MSPQIKRNWRTSLGGAIGVFGTVLIGTPVVWLTTQSCPRWITVTAMSGVFLSAGGKAITAFFAADAKVVEAMQKTFDTDHFQRPDSK